MTFRGLDILITLSMAALTFSEMTAHGTVMITDLIRWFQSKYSRISRTNSCGVVGRHSPR